MRYLVRASLVRVLEQFGEYEEDYVLELDQPRDPSHGDLTTNVALILARKLGRKPRELAGEQLPYGSGDRTDGIKRRGERRHSGERHTPVGDLQPEHTAQCCRDPDRSTGIGPDANLRDA